MRSRPQLLSLVVELALAGLAHAPLSPEDRADFFDGLALILSPAPAEAARYAATCIRESQRAQRDFLTTLELKKETA
jgi:hypothetical protein